MEHLTHVYLNKRKLEEEEEEESWSHLTKLLIQHIDLTLTIKSTYENRH